MKRLTFGLILIAFGILFLLGNMQVIPYNVRDIIYTYWPALLILWGIHEFYDEIVLSKFRTGLSDLFFPTILTTVGFTLLGNRLDLFPNGSVNIWNILLPVVVIFIGLSFLLPSKRKKTVVYHTNGFKDDRTSKENFKEFDKEEFDKDEFKENVKYRKYKKYKKYNKQINLFSSSKGNDTRSVLLGSFEIGKEPWVLEDSSYHIGVGEAKINLTKAYIKEGETRIDVSGCTGEIVIIVPADLAVNVNANLDLGSITMFNEEHSGTPGNVNFKSADYDEAYKKLDIYVKLNIGEIVIKQVY